MEIVGYVLAAFIGISLGLIGGGGSILTVPVLIYFMSVDAITSTAYSLFIVGSTALVGAVNNFFRGNIEVRIGIVFAIPSLIAVWLTRAFVIPALPEVLLIIGDVVLTSDLAIILFFAAIMMLSSISMIRKKRHKTDVDPESKRELNYGKIMLEGLVVGTVTGIVGAGGGFLIIPALVLMTGIPMKKAVGTSLMIIAIKSLIGFTGDLRNPEMLIDWNLLLLFSLLSIGGIFIGGWLSKMISGQNLKRGFGWFLLITGIYMILERFMHL